MGALKDTILEAITNAETDATNADLLLSDLDIASASEFISGKVDDVMYMLDLPLGLMLKACDYWYRESFNLVTEYFLSSIFEAIFDSQEEGTLKTNDDYYKAVYEFVNGLNDEQILKKVIKVRG